MRFDDTIFALSSGQGKAAVAIVRVSGGSSRDVLESMIKMSFPPPRKATLRDILDPETGEKIDKAIVIWFPSTDSYTGENMVEYHVHGGVAVISSLLESLGKIENVRPALAGEFSRRAFEYGKFDLTVAEGIADLVDAETDIQRRQALSQSSGSLGALYEGWRQRLLDLRALVEVTIDFSDQELPDDIIEPVKPEISMIMSEMNKHLEDGHWGERLRRGIQVVIAGPVNVGKSSLFNVLADRQAAIVDAEAGTTRDIIEVHLDVNGWPLTIVDTAGLRDGESEVEAEGIRRARGKIKEADIRLIMLDGGSWPAIPEEIGELINESAVLVLNKCDLLSSGTKINPILGREALEISCKTGFGIEHLLETIKKRLGEQYSPSGSPIISRSRHRHALQACIEALSRYDKCAGSEIGAEELRLAADALGKITGRIDIENILDIIFQDFCIGK